MTDPDKTAPKPVFQPARRIGVRAAPRSRRRSSREGHARTCMLSQRFSPSDDAAPRAAAVIRSEPVRSQPFEGEEWSLAESDDVRQWFRGGRRRCGEERCASSPRRGLALPWTHIVGTATTTSSTRPASLGVGEEKALEELNDHGNVLHENHFSGMMIGRPPRPDTAVSAVDAASRRRRWWRRGGAPPPKKAEEAHARISQRARRPPRLVRRHHLHSTSRSPAVGYGPGLPPRLSKNYKKRVRRPSDRISCFGSGCRRGRHWTPPLPLPVPWARRMRGAAHRRAINERPGRSARRRPTAHCRPVRTRKRYKQSACDIEKPNARRVWNPAGLADVDTIVETELKTACRKHQSTGPVSAGPERREGGESRERRRVLTRPVAREALGAQESLPVIAVHLRAVDR